MKKLMLFLLILSMACDTGNLTFIADLPNSLREVSGMEYMASTGEIWMHNDGENKPRLYSMD
ncbi:MAG: hypothetical protein KJO25_04765, partial [Bacteroidia bacterium]|nr:hypothetical protein [Bacteroidia bacterium]